MSDTEKKVYDIHEEIQSDGQLSETQLSIENAIGLASAEEAGFLAKVLGFSESAEADFADKDYQLLLQGISTLSENEARDVITETLRTHADDRNFPFDLKERMERALAVDPKDIIEEGVSGDFLLRVCAGIMRFSSPYPEVRSTTYFHDNSEEVCETFRSYALIVVWVGIYSFVGQFFTIRQPSIALSSGLCQMLVVPCGMFLARVLPDWGFTFRGTRHSLNPGPWTHKEQSFVTVAFGEMGLVYVGQQIFVQRLEVFYDQKWASLGYQVCMLLSTQFLGFGFAGLFRSTVVYPVDNIFMGNFPKLALNKAFLKPDNTNPVNGWRLTRWHFFGIVFVGVFLYEWLPLYLMQFLSYFNWLTWISPKNFNLAVVTGFEDGLGFNPIPSFDLNFIVNIVSPVFSTVNHYIGVFLAGLAILGIYYTNMYNTAYLPINSNQIFTNTGKLYIVNEVLTDGVLDPVKFQKYSPPFYAAANLVAYGASFASYTCVFVNALLYDGHVIWRSYVEVLKGFLGKHKKIEDFSDPHCRMMAKYPETPQWWFYIVFLIALALALVTIKAFPTEAPVWALFVALGVTILFIVPIAILTARTNNTISTNVLVELIIGYAKPGHGVAMMLIKAFGLMSHVQTISYLSDLKVAHYAKVPPRAAFRGQLLASIVSLFVVFGVIQFQLVNVTDICEHKLIKTTKFTCPQETTYFSASVIWGVIGPKRIFDYQYPLLKWCFLIGCLIPVPFYLARRFFPRFRRQLLLIEPTLVVLGFVQGYAPLNLSYQTGALYTNLLFMGYIRRRYVKWFEKYNYVLSAAIAAAISLSAFIIFFAVQYHPKPLKWWGNTVNFKGIDGTGAARLPLPEAGYFGKAPGSYDY